MWIRPHSVAVRSLDLACSPQNEEQHPSADLIYPLGFPLSAEAKISWPGLPLLWLANIMFQPFARLPGFQDAERRVKAGQ